MHPCLSTQVKNFTQSLNGNQFRQNLFLPTGFSRRERESARERERERERERKRARQRARERESERERERSLKCLMCP